MQTVVKFFCSLQVGAISMQYSHDEIRNLSYNILLLHNLWAKGQTFVLVLPYE